MLSTTERQMLAFERLWWKFPGSKEQEIRKQFGISGTRYYQQLRALIQRPEAMEFDPPLVKRLMRLQEARRGARASRR